MSSKRAAWLLVSGCTLLTPYIALDMLLTGLRADREALRQP